MGYAGFDEAWILENHIRYKRWSEMYEDYKKEHPDCDRPVKYFRSKCNELGLTHRYKPEHDEWLRENYPKLGAKEAFKKFCEHFNITKGYEGFKSHINELGIHCTKKQTIERIQANRTAINVPIGTIREGCRENFIKVGKGTDGWMPMSHYVAGKPGKNEIVVHLDRNIRNNDPDNLMIVNRRASAMVTGCDMWSEHPQINKTALLACELKRLVDKNKRFGSCG